MYMWLSGLKYGLFSQKVSRDFRVFPLDFHWKFNPAHFCHPFLRKKSPTKVFKKWKVRNSWKKIKKKERERHKHKMSTNHHFQKTLVLRTSWINYSTQVFFESDDLWTSPLTSWIIYSNLRNYVEKSIWGLRLRVASTLWCSGCSPSPNSNHFRVVKSPYFNPLNHIIKMLAIWSASSSSNDIF